MSNILPGAVTRLVTLEAEGKTAEADALAAKLAPLFGLVTCFAESERVFPDGTRRVVRDKFRNPVPAKAIDPAAGAIV